MNEMSETPQGYTLTIGADIQCLDERCGKLEKLSVDPESGKTTGLILQRGFLKKDHRILPLDVVSHTDPDQIHVSVQSDELDDYPVYELQVLEEPVEGWTAPSGGGPGGGAAVSPPMMRKRVHIGIPDDQEPIDKGSAVTVTGKKIGTVDRVLVDDESGEISELIVREKGLFPNAYRVPADCIDYVDDQGVQVDLEGKELSSFPAYEDA
jgi:sporulation protein YlmC with PRC-barrel domain